jgi:zinc transport system substrate-binding protein
MRRATLRAALTGTLLVLSHAPALAAGLNVVVTIKPVHALVARVMLGVGTPELLVNGSASPHSYALKPSQVRLLNGADLLFRVSETVEPFTVKLVRTLPEKVEVVTLLEAPRLKLLPRRTGTTFEAHAHGSDRDHGHTSAATHPAAAIDGHAWLDPDNAAAMVDAIERALSAKAAAYATVFKANADALRADLAAVAADLERELEPVAGRPYIVFHDAFQYLERRYGLSVVGSIAVSPEIAPSAKRLAELRRKIMSLGAMCVFAEPQFDTRLVANLIEGTSARTGTLDPEGGRLEPGPNHYFELMRRLAGDLKSCLAPPAKAG